MSIVIQKSVIVGPDPSISAGRVDTTFNIGSGFNTTVFDIKQYGDKILVGGDFSIYSGVSISRSIALLGPNGSLYTSFATGNFNNLIYKLAVQSDSKILAIGTFTTYSGISVNRIIRLNTDGSKDNTFVIGSGFNISPSDIKLQSDEKIVCVGGFTTYSGVSISRIVRLNSNGTIDNTFVIGSGFNSTAFSTEIQSDGKILVCGGFTLYNGTSKNYIVRLNSDGSIDNTFNIGTGFDGSVSRMSLQSDGKILVAGNFSSYNGSTAIKLIRLNTDGSVDNTFNVGTGFNSVPGILKIQSDGKIIVGGLFTSFQGYLINYILRLNSNGSIDYTFVPSNGFNNNLYTILLTNDGDILAGGGFTEYQSKNYNYIVKIKGT